MMSTQKGIEAFALGKVTKEKLLRWVNLRNNFIAQDEDGTIKGYQNKPRYERNGRKWVSVFTEDWITRLDPNPNWRNAIVKVRVKVEIVEDDE